MSPKEIHEDMAKTLAEDACLMLQLNAGQPNSRGAKQASKIKHGQEDPELPPRPI
jgi:hypothetical protein